MIRPEKLKSLTNVNSSTNQQGALGEIPLVGHESKRSVPEKLDSGRNGITDDEIPLSATQKSLGC